MWVRAIGCSDLWSWPHRDVGWAEPVSALIHHQWASVLAEASVGDTDTVKGWCAQGGDLMINARVFRAGEELTDIPVEDLSELRSQPGTLV